MAKIYRKISLLFGLLCCLASAAAWAENPGPGLQLKALRGQWMGPYGAGDTRLEQTWNGTAFVIETKVYFSQAGMWEDYSQNTHVRESWYGFYLQDTVNQHKFRIGMVNPSWDMSPKNIRLGVCYTGTNLTMKNFLLPGVVVDPDDSEFGNRSSNFYTVPKEDGYVRLRVEYVPGEKLAFSFARPGGEWQQL